MAPWSEAGPEGRAARVSLPVPCAPSRAESQGGAWWGMMPWKLLLSDHRAPPEGPGTHLSKPVNSSPTDR